MHALLSIYLFCRVKGGGGQQGKRARYNVMLLSIIFRQGEWGGGAEQASYAK